MKSYFTKPRKVYIWEIFHGYNSDDRNCNKMARVQSQGSFGGKTDLETIKHGFLHAWSSNFIHCSI